MVNRNASKRRHLEQSRKDVLDRLGRVQRRQRATGPGASRRDAMELRMKEVRLHQELDAVATKLDELRELESLGSWR